MDTIDFGLCLVCALAGSLLTIIFYDTRDAIRERKWATALEEGWAEEDSAAFEGAEKAVDMPFQAYRARMGQLAPMEEGGQARDSESLARAANRAMAALAGTHGYPTVSRRLPALMEPPKAQGSNPDLVKRLGEEYARTRPAPFDDPTLPRLLSPSGPGEEGES